MIYTIIGALITLAILATPVIMAVRYFKKPAVTFCTACGTEGPGVMRTRGSFAIEILLWLLLLVPGLIYSIWRITTREPTCPICGSSQLVPPESPMARKLKADLGVTLKTPG